MENFKIIEFHKTRDFSNKLNATFAFVKQNFKALSKSILYIAGPPVLVASLLLSTFMGDIFKLAFGAAGNPGALQNYFLSVNFWLQVILMFVFMMVSYVAIIATTNNYLILYNEQKSNAIDVNDVWVRVRETLGMYFITTLLFGLLATVAYMLMIIPIFVLGAISPFLVFFGVIFLIVGIMYFAVGASLVYAIRAFEKKGFFQAITRSFYLVRGKWWSTFGVLLILSLLVGVISYVFSIPASILQGISMLHKVKSTNLSGPSGVIETIVFVLHSLAYISQLLLYLLPTVGLAFQYFNLVEMKEAKGLMSDIETFGQAPSATVKDESY